MMKNTSTKLNKILNNKTFGSSELVALLNKYFRSIRNNSAQIKESIKLAKNKLGHFEIVNSYLNELNKILRKRNKEDLMNFLTNYSGKEEKKVEIVFRKIYPVLKNIDRVITLSKSKTVIDVLKLWHQKNKKINVVICESRPKNEGRLTAQELTKVGINVELITDSMMGIFVPKVDAAIIGADSVLKSGKVVNKVGSKTLALFCKEYKKPFYVVTTRSKFSKRKNSKAKKVNPKEVWNKSVKNLKISNVYFEEVEKKFITKIFTD
jgi:translation initiation factor 2B subunit (eIF-2B alpha/beta/delta family)